jgi:DNA-binding NarL/FixJ family response regulator
MIARISRIVSVGPVTHPGRRHSTTTSVAPSTTIAISPNAAGVDRLSARELEVVRLVVDGRSNDEIGGALGIGSKTVETHLRRLFERFSIASRTDLATRALREGWLDVPPG